MPPTIRLAQPWPECASGHGREPLARDALAPYLRGQRWFPARARGLKQVDVEVAIPLDGQGAMLLVVAARYEDGGLHRFAMPVAVASGDAAARVEALAPARVIARLEGAGRGVLHDDMSQGLGHLLLEAIASGRRWPAAHGELCGEPTAAFARLRGADHDLPARQVTAEQSNTSVIFGDRLIMKVIRRLEPGLNPDYEIGRHLTGTRRFPGVPALAGALVWHGAAAEPIVVAIAQAFVAGAAPLREPIVRALADALRAAADQRDGHAALDACASAAGADAHDLGRRTADLHLALADARGDEAFAPQPVSAADLAAIAADMRANTASALDQLAERLEGLPAAARDLAATVLARRAELLTVVTRVATVAPGLSRIRVHGDYQLDQVLVAGGEFVVIDFEGEPLRPLAERRARFLALKDVAGMVRSYDYAASSGLFQAAGGDEALAETLAPLARGWQEATAGAFVAGYRRQVGGAPFVPRDEADFDALLAAFIVEKAAYEVRYELNHRPDWVRIPLRGLAGCLPPTPTAPASRRP